MKVFRGLSHATPMRPCALTIGNFDGLHLGHRALLAHVRHAADERDLAAVVMTFEPHPREYFAHKAGDPSKAPTRIANLRDNMEQMAKADIDYVIVEHFNAAFAHQTPQQFIENIVVNGLHTKWLMVGEDFCFGAKRAGNVGTLQEAGKKYGFTVDVLPTVTVNGRRISSSLVRAALAAGDFAQAQALIGHPFMMSGHVVHGKKLGRTLGYPTLNLRVAHKHPAVTGVFIVQVHGLADHALPAVASVGVRPTIEDTDRVLLEAHVLNYDESCYGKIVHVEFLHKIRDEKKFPDLPSMIAAISDDEAIARQYFFKTTSP
jgi:riboflavin kinase/FMN adenylyltransferase